MMLDDFTESIFSLSNYNISRFDGEDMNYRKNVKVFKKYFIRRAYREAEKMYITLLWRKNENERYINRARNKCFFGFSTYKKGEI